MGLFLDMIMQKVSKLFEPPLILQKIKHFSEKEYQKRSRKGRSSHGKKIYSPRTESHGDPCGNCASQLDYWGGSKKKHCKVWIYNVHKIFSLQIWQLCKLDINILHDYITKGSKYHQSDIHCLNFYLQKYLRLLSCIIKIYIYLVFRISVFTFNNHILCIGVTENLYF